MKKIIRKITAVILAAFMGAALTGAPVYADGMTVSAPKYYRVINDYTLDRVDPPVNGKFSDVQSWNGWAVYGDLTGTFKSEVGITGGSGKDAVLYGAVYDTGNRLTAIASDTKETSKETDTLSVTSVVGENRTFKSFVWDSACGMKPLDVQNEAPEISYFFCDDPHTVRLAWFNKGGSYTLYKNGAQVDISGLTQISPGNGDNWGKYPVFLYSDNNASAGDKYIVKNSGVSSDELTAHFEDGAYITMGEYVSGRNMIYLRNDDALWYNDSISKHMIIKGVECETPVSRYYGKTRNTQLYFKMDSDYLSGTGNAVDVTVHYFDDGTGTVYFQYYAGSDTTSLTSAVVAVKTNTNEWKSSTLHLTDVSFPLSTSLVNNCHMRINGGTVSGIEVISRNAPAAYSEISAEVNAAGTAFEGDLELKRWYTPTPTTTDAYDREIRFSGEDGLPDVGGKPYSYNKKVINNGGASWKDWRNAWFFNVPSSFLSGTDYSKVNITVEYYAPSGSGNFGVYFNGDNAKYKTAVVSGEWTTEVFEITDEDGKNSSFNDSYGSDSDFRIMFESCQAYIYKVTVRKYESSTENITIHLVGDSLCENYSSNCYPREGWGMEIGNYFLPNVTVNNAAKGGCTTKSFISEGRFDAITAAAKAGDYLFVQLGHNDYYHRNEERGTSPGDMNTVGTYNYYLKYYADQARALGMIPVFLTSAMERSFENGVQTAQDGIHPYRAAMIATGEALNVPVIDVGSMNLALNNAWGEEGTKKFYCHFSRSDYPNLPEWVTLPDNIHITYIGADEISKMIIRAILADDDLEDLRQYVDTSKDVTQGVSPVTVEEIYAEVNAAGTALNGTIVLDSALAYNSTTSYDKNVLFSGTAGREAIDGKHYLFNQELTSWNGSDPSWRRWKNAFYFKIPDSFLYGTDYDRVVIEVECYIPSGQLQVEFASGSRTNNVTANQWVTSSFEITPSDDVSFSNGLNGCDFRLFAKDCQGYIHKVTVKKIGDGSSNPVYTKKIYLMGDSICAGAGGDSVGWGNVIGSYFKDEVLVTNRAVAGTSTKTYGNYNSVKSAVGSGDYVFIQFGHNDSYLSAPDGRGCDVPTYKSNLTTWVNELKAKGAIPVLLNSVAVHRNLAADGTHDTDNVAPYRVGMQEVAAATGTAFIDVYTPNKTYYNTYWAGTNTGYGFYCTDDVHLTQAGAVEITKIIIQGILDNPDLSVLAAFIRSGVDLTPSQP